MVDIHCHILPGMDDGASDFKTAEQMLQTAAEDGIDTLICTPHYSPKAYRDCPRVLEKLAGSAKAAGIRLLPGMEYSFARLDAGIENLRPLGESSFVLIDLGAPNLPPSIEELFFLLGRNNMQIIIAHPERYLTEVESALELSRLGAFFQLNADSILGGQRPALPPHGRAPDPQRLLPLRRVGRPRQAPDLPPEPLSRPSRAALREGVRRNDHGYESRTAVEKPPAGEPPARGERQLASPAAERPDASAESECLTMLEFLQYYANWIVYPGAAAVFSAFFTFFAIRLLPRLGYVDKPGGRHIHQRIVPRGGGIAIILSFFLVLGILALEQSGPVAELWKRLLPPSLLLGGLGMVDDRFELSSWIKLFVQLLVALIVWSMGAQTYSVFGWTVPWYLSLTFTAVWIIIILNSFNLIDGARRARFGTRDRLGRLHDDLVPADRRTRRGGGHHAGSGRRLPRIPALQLLSGPDFSRRHRQHVSRTDLRGHRPLDDRPCRDRDLAAAAAAGHRRAAFRRDPRDLAAQHAQAARPACRRNHGRRPGPPAPSPVQKDAQAGDDGAHHVPARLRIRGRRSAAAGLPHCGGDRVHHPAARGAAGHPPAGGRSTRDSRA